MAAVPVGNALECVTGGDQTGFIEVAANKLECDRTAASVKPPGRVWLDFLSCQRTAEAQQARDQLRILAQRRICEGRCAVEASLPAGRDRFDSATDPSANGDAGRESGVDHGLLRFSCPFDMTGKSTIPSGRLYGKRRSGRIPVCWPPLR